MFLSERTGFPIDEEKLLKSRFDPIEGEPSGLLPKTSTNLAAASVKRYRTAANSTFQGSLFVFINSRSAHRTAASIVIVGYAGQLRRC